MTFLCTVLVCGLFFFVIFLSAIQVTLKCIETGLPSQTACLCRGGIMRYCKDLGVYIFEVLYLTVQSHVKHPREVYTHQKTGIKFLFVKKTNLAVAQALFAL